MRRVALPALAAAALHCPAMNADDTVALDDAAEEVRAALVRMRLIDAAERPRIVPLAGGVSSFIVRAETRRGPVCVKRALPRLKVAAEWFAPIERSSAEVAWIRLAARVAGEAVPAILGEDSVTHAFAMAYLDPATHPVWKSQLLAGRAEMHTARAVAGVLARVHASTASRADTARAFANDATFHAIRLEPYFVAAARRHPDCAAALDALVTATAASRIALMHGDVSPKNILVGPKGPVLLDAEAACYGDPAFDLAFCLTHLMLKCVHRPDAAASYLGCFDAFASAYLGAADWEASAALEARACGLLAGMLLARVDGKSPVEYLTREADRERVRSFARRFLRTAAVRLADMRAQWAGEGLA